MTELNKRKADENLHNILITDTLSRFLDKSDDGNTKLSEILDEFHENSFLLSLIFFAIPVAIPLPYPPLFTTVMSIPLFLLSIQMIFGYERVSIPTRLENYNINNKTLKMISRKSIPILKKIEKYLKPRYSFARYVIGEKVIGFVSLLCCICIAIPLPFTNAAPAQAIVIMSLGMVGHDGLIVLAGIAWATIGVIIASIATILSFALLVTIFGAIKMFFIQIFAFFPDLFSKIF